MRTLSRMTVMAALLSVATVMGASAKTTKHAKKAAAETMQCPKCKMMMASTKSEGAPLAVKVKGHTYYCCTGCGMATKSGHSKKSHKTEPK